MVDETVVSSNATETLNVGTGESLTNAYIDVTADGAGVTIAANATGWEIRHLAIEGYNPLGCLSVSDRSDGHSAIDNLWLASGGDNVACYVDQRHSGVIDATRIRAEGFSGGGFHSSAPVNRAGGATNYERIYAAGNGEANFRTGTDSLELCHAVDGAHVGRGLWAHGNTDVVNSSFYTGGTHYAVEAGIAGRDVTVTLDDSAIDNNYNGGLRENGNSAIEATSMNTSTTTSPPPGVPQMVEDATGGSGEFAPVGDPNLGERDFEVITPQYDTHAELSISSGETLENVVIDLNHARTAATITAEGSGWTIRNVAFAGEMDKPETAPCHAIQASVNDGSTGRIENVWLGDGSSVGECGDNGRGGVYVRSDHGGTLEIANSSFQSWPGGGVTASENTSGDIVYDSCYFDRIGYEMMTIPSADSYANNIVIVNETGDFQ